MNDETEGLRIMRLAELNASPGSREELESKHGKVWDTGQLIEEFEIVSFLAPFAVGSRRSDGMMGSLEFQHSPRFYFNWKPHN